MADDKEKDAPADLKAAEAEVKEALAEVKKAEADLERAEKHLEEAEHEENEKKDPKVFFEDMNSLESVKFRTPLHTKLTEAWDEAVKLLKEPRRPTDRLQTPEGTDLMPYLGLTLRELEERKIVTALKFQIVGPTGGA